MYDSFSHGPTEKTVTFPPGTWFDPFIRVPITQLHQSSFQLHPPLHCCVYFELNRSISIVCVIVRVTLRFKTFGVCVWVADSWRELEIM